jgi:hypothetical protein
MCGNNIYSPPLNKAVEQIARDLKICDSDMLQQICKKIISMWVRLKLSIDN